MKRAILIATVVGAAALAVGAGSMARRSAHKPQRLTRYSLVHGCYRVRTASGQLQGPYRMQATTLATYLLYSSDGRFAGPGLSLVSAPSGSTEWRVGGHFTLTN